MMRIRVLATVAMLVAALLVPVPSSVLAGNQAWGWTVSRIANGYQDYTPLDADQGNAHAQLNHIVRTGKGQYTATFESVGTEHGIVHVTPLGSTSRICTVSTWNMTSVSTERAFIRCFSRIGAPVDTPFVVNYWYLFAFAGNEMGHVWANQPTAASYDPHPDWSWNSTGGTNHIVRTAVGHYTVTMPGLGGLNGNVQVTAKGSDPATCLVAGWGSITSTQEIDVVCRNVAGAFVDQSFNLSYVNELGLHGDDTGESAHIWADQPTAASYLPSSSYRWSTSGQGPRVLRSGTGQYTVRLLGITGEGGSAQVTAYGTGKTRCQVSSIPTSGQPQTVGVRCFKFDGTAKDSRFSFIFTR